MSHLIRFRAAWIRTIGSESARVDLPDAADQGVSVVTYTRSFNAPTGVSESTPIQIVVENWRGGLTAYLDDSVLVQNCDPSLRPFQHSLSGKLSGFHKLTLILEDLGNGVELRGPCYLSIA